MRGINEVFLSWGRIASDVRRFLSGNGNYENEDHEESRVLERFKGQGISEIRKRNGKSQWKIWS